MSATLASTGTLTVKVAHSIKLMVGELTRETE